MSGPEGGWGLDAAMTRQTSEPRRALRLFLVALAVMVLGAAVQFAISGWSLNPQVFLAINVVVEVSRAALCFFVFGVRWLTRQFRVDPQSLFISCSFLALGILTVARLLTFSGMPLSGSYSELVNAPYFGTFSNFSDSLYYDALIRISIGGLLLIGTLLSSTRVVERPAMKYYPLGLVTFAGVGILVISVFDYLLPPLYIQGEGLTQSRSYIGLVAIVVTFVSAVVYARLAWRTREGGYLMVSLGLLVMTEAQFSFAKVANPLDVFLLVGRTMSLVAWFFIFIGLVRPSLVRPYVNLEAARRRNEIDEADLERLSNDVMERTEAEKQIRILNAELESTNKELESFCYSVSHDLRAPLRGINGFSKLLDEDTNSKLSEQGRDYLTKMRNASERMAIIIDDLLKLSRVVREEISMKEFDIAALARSVANDVIAANPGRDSEFITCDSELVVGDERLMRIALENLLQNAWKFTSKTAHARIEFGVTRSGGGRVFFVKDNGAGFNMQYSEKLFRPFERLHSDVEFPGTGVGLANVARVIERHGGKVWAEGRIGEGATFYFTLGNNTNSPR